MCITNLHYLLAAANISDFEAQLKAESKDETSNQQLSPQEMSENEERQEPQEVCKAEEDEDKAFNQNEVQELQQARETSTAEAKQQQKPQLEEFLLCLESDSSESDKDGM